MLARRKGWIGVDVGTRTVKLAQLERAGGRLRLRDAVVVSRAVMPAQEDEAHLTWCSPQTDIRAAVTLTEHLKGRKAACVLSMHASELYTMFVPPATVAERREIIAQQLESLLDPAAQPSEFDYWDIPTSGRREDEENVNVISIRHGWARQLARDISRAGLRCEILDALPQALARCVQLVAGQPDGPAVAAIDWGYLNTTFCLVADGRPVFTRRFPNCGLGRITEALQNVLAVSAEEAQQLLTTQGLPDPDQQHGSLQDAAQVIAEVAADTLSEFLDQINRTLSYFAAGRKQLVPERIWLLGGGATVKNVVPCLAREIPAAIEIWTLPENDAMDQRLPASAPVPMPLLGPAIALSALAWER